ARTADERRFGLARGTRAGVVRMRLICENHRDLLAEMVRFVAAGHRIDIIVGNHDLELLEPEVVEELIHQLQQVYVERWPERRIESGLLQLAPEELIRARIRVVPWFVYEPQVAWIEHGHIYDEGCSYEYNLAPNDKDGR